MRSVFAVSVVAVALLAAGCGSSDGSGDEATPTEEWASSVCSALTTWSEAIKEVGTTLQASPTADGLEEAADQAKSATETLVDDLEAAGRPDTEAGQEAQDALQTASDDLVGQRRRDRETQRTTSRASAVSWPPRPRSARRSPRWGRRSRRSSRRSRISTRRASSRTPSPPRAPATASARDVRASSTSRCPCQCFRMESVARRDVSAKGISIIAAARPRPS